MSKLSVKMDDTMRKIALYGGVFDPVHAAHLAVAQAAVAGAELDAVIFLPAASSPHKSVGPVATDAQRLAMLHAATEGEAAFSVDAWELERGGISYSVDTAAHFRTRYPKARLFWILGADHWARLPDWKQIEELSAMVEFLVLARPGYPLEPSQWPKIRHSLVAAPELPESASRIRQQLASGRSIQGMVDPAVEAFILSNNLYL
jgi:nicotinate-nucleotide adenylyltransferase